MSEIKNPDVPAINREYAANHVQRRNMSGFRAPPLETVRVGMIGMGRGVGHIQALVRFEGVEIRAICDKTPAEIDYAAPWFKDMDPGPDVYTDGEDEWKKLCERDDLDLIYICTPVPLHAQMSIYALRQGKHVCSEVPVAWRMEDCWELVKAAEEAERHFMMLENYSYMDFQLVMINMAKHGFFGDIVHAEGAYNTSKLKNNFRKNGYSDMWWLRAYGERRGNVYPTHGLGPVATCLDINRGDRLAYLTSMESNDFTHGPRARELAQEDAFYEEFVDLPYRGNMSVTMIRTAKGRTMMVQHDAHTPSPHNLIHGVYGTKGAALFDPPPPRFSKGDNRWYTADQDEYKQLYDEYTPTIFSQLEGASEGHGHGGSDLRMNWHLIDCLRNGLPMPMDVYDAVTWSAIAPLSHWSVLNRSDSIEVPDFTCGAWADNVRNMDINLENGGGTTVIGSGPEVGDEYDDELARQWRRDHALKDGTA